MARNELEQLTCQGSMRSGFTTASFNNAHKAKNFNLHSHLTFDPESDLLQALLYELHHQRTMLCQDRT